MRLINSVMLVALKAVRLGDSVSSRFELGRRNEDVRNMKVVLYTLRKERGADFGLSSLSSRVIR